MTRVMRDSITAKAIPVAGCDLFAGYDNGSISKWSTEDWSLFAAWQQVHIDVLGTSYSSDVLDVEQGNPTDQDGGRDFSVTVNWVKEKQSDPVKPILYANQGTLTPMFNALEAAGFYVVKNFLLWIATGAAETVKDMTGVVAVQYQLEPGGKNYDQSIVYDDSWKVKPVVATPPVVTRTPAYLVYMESGTQMAKIVWSTDGGKSWQ
jgi:hypothetical protein